MPIHWFKVSDWFKDNYMFINIKNVGSIISKLTFSGGNDSYANITNKFYKVLEFIINNYKHFNICRYFNSFIQCISAAQYHTSSIYPNELLKLNQVLIIIEKVEIKAYTTLAS